MCNYDLDVMIRIITVIIISYDVKFDREGRSSQIHFDVSNDLYSIAPMSMMLLLCHSIQIDFVKGVLKQSLCVNGSSLSSSSSSAFCLRENLDDYLFK